MSISYSFFSKIYGLLDIIYFRQNRKNSRFILINKISDNDSKLLEIAIGTAKNSILLAKNKSKINITGIDLSEDMLKIARNNITKEKIKNIELVKMDGANMAFNDETFDFIIISLLFHELSEQDANKILSECAKKLKHDGKLYILEWEEPKEIIQKIIFLPIKLFESKEYKKFMQKDLSVYFSRNGFQIKSIEYGNYSKVMELSKNSV